MAEVEAVDDEAHKGRRGSSHHGGWKCVPFILGNETFEKVASFGLLVNLMVYLVNRFNIKPIDAANLTNIFFGTSNFAPLLGAFLSDAYLGRFRTLAFGSFATFFGLLGFTICASSRQLQPPECDAVARQAGLCVGPTSAQTCFLYLMLGFLIVGSGAVRPTSLPFGVDQFDPADDRSSTGLDSFFNWYYGTTAAALVFAITVLVYIQSSISWPVGFGIPAALMLASIVVFFLGTRLYVHVPPEGSIFSGIVRVFVAAFRKRHLQLPCPDDAQLQELALYNSADHKSSRNAVLPLTLQFTFLNKAAMAAPEEINPDGTINKWRLCTVQQVEEVKCLLRIIPIWFSGVLCFVANAQQFTFITLQALTMGRHLGPNLQIPAGSVSSISFLALALFIPIYDRVLVPMARRITKVDSGITLLQRQGIGLAISPISMLVAAVVEKKRRESSSPLSVFWLTPQLVVMGVAEAFNAVGQIEFYNTQFPEHLQTLAGSLFYCSLAGSSYLSSVLISAVRSISRQLTGTSWLNDNIDASKVDYYYYVIAVLGVLNVVYFVICAKYYRYKGVADHATRSSSA